MHYGTCFSIFTQRKGESFDVVLQIDHKEMGRLYAILPEREKAALLPRCIFCPGRLSLPEESLLLLSETLKKLLVGRQVKVWRYQEDWYCAFPSWRSVKIKG